MIGRKLAWTLLVIAALTAVSPLAISASRLAPVQHDHRLPLDFPHQQHNTIRCLDCHHEVKGMANKTMPCVACHRSGAEAIKLSVEPRFHAFCRDCHAEKSRQNLPHGPVRDCGACHRHPSLP